MADLAIQGAAVEAPRKRFGTFLGVFTPSILTILGVIMYQRFGWVVGNSGLVGALGIVALAHVISVTTGLSVASIATNHRVGTGGNYYIISRSLGLSIGGAIGLALYMALALGVSLYLIGFAEAVLAATHWDPTHDAKNNIRLVGTAACAAIAVVTLFSTDIALKSQLLVLALIGLSLVSIFLGRPLPTIPGESPVAMGPPLDAPSFATVFAVFFPAVTGFTAGVGMSGDLKDPKRAIPVGTMAAIFAGLVIYTALPIFIAAHASTEELRRNNNVLLEVARWPLLVTLGVAAATLSSALGSILGAPRTLQALAFDGIVPRFLGRGREEPRVALVVTIVIAEAGILLAELEAVGAVISMFFLTCYGFLCLACGLERWASPDFRPQFKVPIWVSLLGALASFLVMFQINALAMFASIVIMGLVYLVLKRRQLALSTGDTWGGVWSAVVRSGLLRLRQSRDEATQQKWRPNMILMGRKSPGRPSLIEFGRAVVGDRGILTHIELVPGAPPRARADKELEAQYPGLFARVQGVDDVFASIPQIAANFGFVGMETNVVLLGWPREAASNDAYGAMLDRLLEVDLSVLMLRFDPERGFGKRERIDVWWDGVAPTGQLMLTLAHLLTSSPSWKGAHVRVLVNGRPGADLVAAQKRLDALVAGARIAAEGRVLTPLTDAQALAERVRRESSFADLVIVHALDSQDGSGFVPRNDRLLSPLGTALLVRPSSAFQDVAVVFAPEERPSTPPPAPRSDGALPVPLPIPLPEDLRAPLMRFEAKLQDAIERFHAEVLQPSSEEGRIFARSLVSEVEAIRQLDRRLSRRGRRREAARALVDWAKNRFGSAVIELTGELVTPRTDAREAAGIEMAWARRLREGVTRLQSDVQEALLDLPVFVSAPTEPEEWSPHEGDAAWFRFLKLRIRASMRIFGGGRAPLRRVPLRAVVSRHLGPTLALDLEEAVRRLGVRRYETIGQARRLCAEVARFFQTLTGDLDRAADPELGLDAFRDFVTRELMALEDVGRDLLHREEAASRELRVQISALLDAANQRALGALADPVVRLGSRAPVVPSRDERAARRSSTALGELPESWAQQHAALAAAMLLDVQVEWLTVEARRAAAQVHQKVRREVEAGPLASLARAREVLEEVRSLREQGEPSSEPESGSDAIAPAGESSGSIPTAPAEGSEPEPQAEDVGKRFLAAADALRATWETPYRPEPRELIDQLLLGLGRAADRLPELVTTMPEEALEAAAEGVPSRTQVSYPARRLAQNFLEKRLAQPARERLRALPDHTRAAQDQLVDAVRLVAFDLEQQALGRAADDAGPNEPVEPAAFGAMLVDRVRRLGQAEADLERALEELRGALVEEPARTLVNVRDAVTGAAVASQASGLGLGAARTDLAARAQDALQAIRGRVSAAAGRVRSPVLVGRRPGPLVDSLADALLDLRTQLVPHPEVQAALPLLYRRIFGRAALENADLLRGREAELAVLERMVARWKAGAAGPVAILGEPRSGKSTLVNVLTRTLLADHTTVRVAAPSGGAGAEALNEAVVRAVGGRAGQSAEIALRAMPPGAVLVVDDLGRWLDRGPGGLAALRAWHQLWRRLGDRHLFVMTASQVAWRYAATLTPLAESVLDTVVVGGLDRDELADVLLLRQRTSDFELVFEDDGGGRRRGFGWSEAAQLRRLHERSQGNVGDALDLWRRSIVRVSERTVTLSVGPDPDLGVLRALPLRWYAALSAIVLHRTVTTPRLARWMRISREEALGLLTDLERAGLVTAERGSYGLDPVLQPYLLRALRERGVLG
jgi:amino acid transporter